MNSGFGPSPDHQQSGYPGQPGHPGVSGYGAAAYQPGYSAAAYDPGATSGSNPAGRVSLAAGVLVVVIGLVQQVVGYLMPMLITGSGTASYETYRLFSYAAAGTSVLIGIVAVVAGSIGLRAPGRPKAAAGAGVALGAWAILSAVVGFAVPAIMTGF